MNDTFRVMDKVSWKELDGLIVVVDTESGAYYSLNKTASEMWKELVDGKAKEAVVKILEEKYNVPGTELQNDLDGCIAEWRKQNLIIEKT